MCCAATDSQAWSGALRALVRGGSAGMSQATTAHSAPDTSMTVLDWFVLVATIGAIVVYGVWRSRHVRDLDGFVRGSSSLRWPTIGLGIMATQASAITFLSLPGQAYEDGMRFVQV